MKYYSTPVRTIYGLYSLIRYALPESKREPFFKDSLMLLYMYYLRSYNKIKNLELRLMKCVKITEFNEIMEGIDDIDPSMEKHYLEEVETLLEDIEECHATIPKIQLRATA